MKYFDNLSISVKNNFKDIQNFYLEYTEFNNDKISIVDYANKKFIKNELIKHQEFFDNFNGKSLDDQQREAILTDEYNTRIIAGAGTGKTLTLEAKIKFLIEKRNIKPNEILCISYSNASVEDLKNRLKKSLGEDIKVFSSDAELRDNGYCKESIFNEPNILFVKTFHKIGTGILKQFNKPYRPKSDNLSFIIKHYFKNKVINNEVLMEKIIKFFAYYPYVPIDKTKNNILKELYELEEGRDYSTLKQKFENYKDTYNFEIVKSFEELLIANFLFLHNIRYIYEIKYDRDNVSYKEYLDELYNPFNSINNLFEMPKNEFFDYRPDFYLPDYDIYIEHFGVDKNCNAKWLKSDKAKSYKKNMKNKINFHKDNGTKLIKTYSAYMEERILLSKLKDKLLNEGVIFKEVDYDEIYLKLIDNMKVFHLTEFINLIESFINLFKGNGYTKKDFKVFINQNNKIKDDFAKKRNNLFFDIVEEVYDYYQRNLIND